MFFGKTQQGPKQEQAPKRFKSPTADAADQYQVEALKYIRRYQKEFK